MLQKKFAVLGGDQRQLSVVERLCASAGEVRVFGLPTERLSDGVRVYSDWRAAIREADVLLLPLPASPDGVRVACPLTPERSSLLLRELLREAPPKAEIFGGRFSPAVKSEAEALGRELKDYCEVEDFQLKNAIPTAEGAVEILMAHSTRTIHGMQIAVTGYGRVARALCRLLVAMGAEVTVGARRRSALQEAAANGCRTVHLLGEEDLDLLCAGKTAVFNTVPHWIFRKPTLKKLPRSLLLIDLASAPGGVDAEVARGLGIPVIFALSLPGKYAPQTAGEIIADVVLSALRGEVVL